MKILLGALRDRAEELVSFLEPRVGTKPSSSGSEIEIEDSTVRQGVKPRQVKTYVKRFLHKTGQRKAFRVLVAGGELSIVQLEGGEEQEPAGPTGTKQEEAKPEPVKEAAPKEKEEAKPTEPKKKARRAKKAES
ncbi:MAG: hypothetical protein HYU03_01650 [Thaumarchaeota archaeon]|nr:hypothetical protein [Nitrososphaerota archaeon]MBI3115994.1 hypothetical protein [Nitrososphaerota archaeon]MCS4539381.1 hypothetical protein [Nitrososphaerota archaeon]